MSTICDGKHDEQTAGLRKIKVEGDILIDGKWFNVDLAMVGYQSDYCPQHYFEKLQQVDFSQLRKDGFKQARKAIARGVAAAQVKPGSKDAKKGKGGKGKDNKKTTAKKK